MCQTIPNPAIEIEFDDVGTLTNRERLRMHVEGESCVGCHTLMDPIGFALENFDDLGRYREEDDDGMIDASGYVLLTQREEREQLDVVGAEKLAETFSELEQVRECFATQMFRSAVARDPKNADSCALEGVADELKRGDGDLRSAYERLVVSDAFRYVRRESGADGGISLVEGRGTLPGL